MSQYRDPLQNSFPVKETLTLIGVIITAYIGYLGIRSQTELPLEATKTAEVRSTLSAPQEGENANAEVPKEDTPTNTSVNTLVPTATSTFTPTFTLTPTFTSSSTATYTPSYTPTNTVTYTPSYTPTKTFTPSPKSISLNGKSLSMNLPSFATLPDVRGSITFNTNVEIAQTKKITVRLDVRNGSGTQWAHSNPILLYQLSSGDKFCSITRADYNSTNYYLGYQAHCKSSDACSYNIEGNSKLWVTIGKVYIIIAPAGGKCP